MPPRISSGSIDCFLDLFQGLAKGREMERDVAAPMVCWPGQNARVGFVGRSGRARWGAGGFVRCHVYSFLALQVKLVSSFLLGFFLFLFFAWFIFSSGPFVI